MVVSFLLFFSFDNWRTQVGLAFLIYDSEYVHLQRKGVVDLARQ